MSASIALPGQLLGPASTYRPGPGVHLHDSQLYSSLLGAVSVSQPSAAATAPGPAKRLTKITLPSSSNNPQAAPELPTISVTRRAREVLPQVGNVVLCRVTRITPRQAVVAILVCGETVLEAEWQGVIRVQDVRATEKDRIRVYESFRPGDIVRASVVSFVSMLMMQGLGDTGAVANGDGSRFLSVTRATTTSLRRATSTALSWRLARLEIRCILCRGKNTRIRRRG